MIYNYRDLGGIRTSTGRTIRHGCLVRSARLSEAEEVDMAGVSAVIDLRTKKEIEEVPDKQFKVDYLRMPIFEELMVGISHERGATAKPRRSICRKCLPGFYCG